MLCLGSDLVVQREADSQGWYGLVLLLVTRRGQIVNRRSSCTARLALVRTLTSTSSLQTPLWFELRVIIGTQRCSPLGWATITHILRIWRTFVGLFFKRSVRIARAGRGLQSGMRPGFHPLTKRQQPCCALWHFLLSRASNCCIKAPWSHRLDLRVGS